MNQIKCACDCEGDAESPHDEHDDTDRKMTSEMAIWTLFERPLAECRLDSPPTTKNRKRWCEKDDVDTEYTRYFDDDLCTPEEKCQDDRSDGDSDTSNDKYPRLQIILFVVGEKPLEESLGSRILLRLSQHVL